MKKLLSYIIVISIMLTTAVSGFAYSDIGSEHGWAKDAIEYLSEKNILNGYDDGAFKPDADVTRAELAKILVCAYDLKEKSISAISYSDIVPSDWYSKYVNAASDLFITPDRKFYPEKQATREEVAFAIYKASKIFDTKQPLKFEDTAEISNDYYDAISSLFYNKIITGYPNNTFGPKSRVTRAEAAAMVHRALTFSVIPEPSRSPTPTDIPSSTEAPEKTPEVKANNYFGLVIKSAVAVENGEKITRLTVLSEGIEEEVVVKDNCKITSVAGDDTINRNDIISYFRDYFGDVRTLQVIYRLGTNTSGLTISLMPTYKFNNTSATIIGEAIKKYPSAIELEDSKGKTGLYGISKNANVYIYKSGKLELSDISMLQDTTYEDRGDYILAVLYDDLLEEILIIKE